MFKNILLPIDGSEYSKISIAYGIWLSKRFNASLNGLHVVDIIAMEGPFVHDISGSLGFEPYMNLSEKMKTIMEEKAASIMDYFKIECENNGISYNTNIVTGIIPNEILEYEKLADLVIMGQRGVNAQFERGLLGSTTEVLTRKSFKPLLITPSEFIDISNPILAYDGSIGASKSMEMAAEFCSQTGMSITILIFTKNIEDGNKIIRDAKDYLKAYKIEVNYNVIEGHPHEELLTYISSNKKDLLFMGSHGHNRIVEMVLGSTTEYVLRNSTWPVFLKR